MSASQLVRRAQRCSRLAHHHMHLVPRGLKDKQKAPWASISFAGRQFVITLSQFPHYSLSSSLCSSALLKEVDKASHRVTLKDFTPHLPYRRAIPLPLSPADWAAREGKEQGAVGLNESPLWLTMPILHHTHLRVKSLCQMFVFRVFQED